MYPVLIELIICLSFTLADIKQEVANFPNFVLDESYPAIPIETPSELSAQLAENRQQVIMIRGHLTSSDQDQLKALPNVINVWQDGPIEGFAE